MTDYTVADIIELYELSELLWYVHHSDVKTIGPWHGHPARVITERPENSRTDAGARAYLQAFMASNIAPEAVRAEVIQARAALERREQEHQDEIDATLQEAIEETKRRSTEAQILQEARAAKRHPTLWDKIRARP